MVEVTLTSRISGRVVKASYTARQLLDTDEISLVMNMTKCKCDEEWKNYELVIGEHDEEVKRLKYENLSLKEDLQHVHNTSVRGLMKDDMCALEDIRNHTINYSSY